MSKKQTVAFMQKIANIMMKGIRKLAEKVDTLEKRIQALESRTASSGGGMRAPAPAQPPTQPPAQQYAQPPAAPIPQQAPPPQAPQAQATPAPARVPPPRAAPPSATSAAGGPGPQAGAPPPPGAPSGMSRQQEMLQELKSLFGK
ncbi:MAG: hypothetical protein ACW976_00635 [Candidatus Ranarchaeia archaeon]